MADEGLDFGGETEGKVELDTGWMDRGCPSHMCIVVFDEEVNEYWH